MDGIYGRERRFINNFATRRQGVSAAGSDIRNILRIDYAEIIAVASLMCESESALQRVAALQILELIWNHHATAKETAVYRVLMDLHREGATRECAMNGFATHGRIDRLLDGLIADIRVETELWTANANSLRHLLGQQFGGERAELFDALAASFDQGKLDALEKNFCLAKTNGGTYAALN
jgi:hypothetical protein